MPRRTAGPRQAQSVARGSGQCSIEVKPGLICVENHRQMVPVIQRERSLLGTRIAFFRIARCGLLLLKVKRRGVSKSRRGNCRLGIGWRWCLRNGGPEVKVRLASSIADLYAFRRIEFEHVLVARKGVPFDPAFERRDVQSLEKFGWQFEIITVAGQSENTARAQRRIGRRSGTRGNQVRGLTSCGRGK